MKIALVGRVAEGKELFDGQTVKTRYLYELLKQIDDVVLVDTYEYKKHIVSMLFSSIKALSKSDAVVLSISINGRRFFFPFFYYLNKIYKKNIYHSLIGGRLASNIEKYPSWKKYVNSFKINWVESHELVSLLNNMGVMNAQYLPNFKKLEKAELLETYSFSEPYRYCMFSRVQKQKGITDAIDTIFAINSQYGCKKATLDIYGPIDEDFKTEFFELLDKHSDYIVYKGSVDAAKSVETLQSYYMLLFPTRYFNEGIPGTIIDAMAAGVPVIARKWHYCSEMLTHQINGLVYDFDDIDGLFEMIKYSIENEDLVVRMKPKCLEKADEYLFETAFKMIKAALNKGTMI